ncbi:MAG: bacillithiol biosynthesis deacetylase BshB1 [Candidatus Sumerlaeia bacterium]|nr:bacillithiol biosynthesis deacetylase BshB1 [Candidatus Sumerlaeia bacterium]
MADGSHPQSEAIFFCAHPDDGELLAGGLMASMASRGARVILIDATRGEMGTRGTPEGRDAEGAEAARILGVERDNLELPDGGIGRDMDATIHRIVRAIRQYRPRLVFTHTGTDHHPDHNDIHVAVRRAFFLANVMKYDTGQERFRPRKLMYFWSHRHEVPPSISFIADITDHWETKVRAIKAHRSQVDPASDSGPETYLTSDLFWHRIESRFGFFGSLINVRYGEPYLVEGVARVDDPLQFPDVSE